MVVKKETKNPVGESLKNPGKKKLLIFCGFLAIAALLYFFKGLFFVAIVNGQPISRILLVQEIEKQFGKQVLDSEITKILILQEARKKNVSVDPKEIAGEIGKIEENLKSQGQDLNQALAIQGMTRDSLANQIMLQKTIEKLLGNQISVTDQEVSDYIEKNKDAISSDAKPEEVRNGVKEQLEQQKLSEKINSWIEELRQNAKITSFVNF